MPIYFRLRSYQQLKINVSYVVSRASDRSPFDGSCCSGYRPVDSASLDTPDEDELDPVSVLFSIFLVKIRDNSYINNNSLF